jgi:NAD(P)-dependent dehydrogenase (short-subunit alcohol dehydrogenase family)
VSVENGLAGRSVLVTGAGDGIGRGAALACGAAGAFVVVAARGDNGAETVAQVEGGGGSATWARCDVTDAGEVESAVRVAVDKAGGLDVIVHNATSRRSSEPERLDEVDPEGWAEHASVSLTGAYLCARAAFPALQERRGRFLAMTSASGMEGSTTFPVYATVKAALRGFAKSLAREWAPMGVTVNVLSPLARTPAMDNAILEDPDLEARLARRVPLGRMGDAETDIGPAVVFLAGDGGRYITGQTLVVDGGRFMTL